MAKVLPQDIKDLQFVAEQFNSVVDFDAFVQAVIDEQEALLVDRIGSVAFATTGLSVHIKRAEKCLVAAELLQLRINRLSGNIDAETAVLISQLKKNRQDYLDQADRVVPRLVAGSVSEGSDAAFGYASSSHFDGDAP